MFVVTHPVEFRPVIIGRKGNQIYADLDWKDWDKIQILVECDKIEEENFVKEQRGIK